MRPRPLFAASVGLTLLLALLVLVAAAQGPAATDGQQWIEARRDLPGASRPPLALELVSESGDGLVLGAPTSPAAVTASIGPDQDGSACAPGVAEYQLQVQNDGEIPDIIEISALADNFWPAAVEPTFLDLEVDGTGIVTVTVEIPWYALAGDTQVLSVTATAQTSGLQGEARIQTTAALAAAWDDLAVSPHAASDPAIVHEDGYLYQIGGYDGTYHGGNYRYDIAGDAWTTMASMITATAHMDAAAIEGSIYVPGGETVDFSWNRFLQVYSTATDAWSSGEPMTIPVRYQEVVAVDGLLYVLGGQTADNIYTDTVQIYDPLADAWSDGAPIPIPVAYAASGVIDGKIYLAGGYNDSGYQSALQIYDPAADSWSAGAGLPVGWAQAADGVKHNRYLILAGGSGGPLDTGSASGWFYDAAHDAWYALPNAGSSRYGAEGDGNGNEFYYLGGVEDSGTPLYSGKNELLVQCGAPAAQARLDVTALSATACAGTTELLSFGICNDGNAPLQFSTQEILPATNRQAPQSPSAVLRDQPVTSANPHGYPSQDFEPVRDPGDIFIADDFTNSQWWAIDRIYVPGRTFNPQGDEELNLRCAGVLHWEIYADKGGRPAGDPWGGGEPPVWTYYGATSDPRVVISAGWGGYYSEVTLNLAVPVTLPPGDWWLVFYPSMSLSDCFQYGRRVSTTRNGEPAQVINPGGGLPGFSTSWTSVEDITVWDPFPYQDFSFRLEGVTMGDVAWLSEDPPTGAVEGGQCTTVEVLFDATGLAPGAYYADLLVGSSDPSTPSSSLPLTLTVPTPAEILDVTYAVNRREVTFDASATGQAPLGFAWDFGDGLSSNVEDPVHAYEIYDCYAVALSVDNACATDTWTADICLERPKVYLPLAMKNW